MAGVAVMEVGGEFLFRPTGPLIDLQVRGRCDADKLVVRNRIPAGRQEDRVLFVLQTFQKQFTDGARSWGPYALGPAAIANMWNQTSRSFGAAFIGEKTSEEAAQELVDYVDNLL